MMSAVTGFDDGKDGRNASTNNVAGRSQSSIAAVSIGTVPQLQGLAVAPVCSPNAGRMPGIVGARHPATYGAATAGGSPLCRSLTFLARPAPQALAN